MREFQMDQKDTRLLNQLSQKWKECRDNVALAEKELDGHRDQFRKAHLEEVEEVHSLQRDICDNSMVVKDEPAPKTGGGLARSLITPLQPKQASLRNQAAQRLFKAVTSDKTFQTIEHNENTPPGFKATLLPLKTVVFHQQPTTELEENMSKVLDMIDFSLRDHRQWIYLDSIFNSSETIRKQVPSVAREFSKVNAE